MAPGIDPEAMAGTPPSAHSPPSVEAEALVEMGFYVSFSGILTFRNASALRKVACQLPATQVLVETDSPYLAPVPYRGKRNEPAFVAEVVRMLASVRSASFDEIARTTTRNAQRLFRFPA